MKYWHFVPILKNEMAEAVEIFPCERQRLVYPLQSLIAIFSPYFILVGLLLQSEALFQSGNWLSIRGIVNWCRVAISNDKST